MNKRMFIIFVIPVGVTLLGFSTACSCHKKQKSVQEIQFNRIGDSLREYKPELEGIADLEKDKLLNDYLRLNYNEFRVKYNFTEKEMEVVSQQFETTYQIARSFRDINNNIDLLKDMEFGRPEGK